jgi:hypothetical protein
MKKPELPAAPPPSAATPPRALKHVKPPPPPPPRPDDDLLCDPEACAAEPIIGSGDRMHHLALVAGHGTVQLRPAARRGGTLPPLRPTSRAACERRCGRAGQCDPASPHGCGGEFCRGLEERVTEQLCAAAPPMATAASTDEETL